MHHLQHIADLGGLLAEEGISRIVIPPGSRNAPLIQYFTGNKAFHCHSIVDERSAGYVALGMARMEKEPVAIVTTSGTAVLNLGPALAEAFYQMVPLIAITSDRPRSPVPQFDNQVVDQGAPFFTFSKGFFEFPAHYSMEQDLHHSVRACRMLVRESSRWPAGPVHINVVVDEPLYVPLPPPLFGGIPLPTTHPGSSHGEKEPEKPRPGSRVMLLAGMGDYRNGFTGQLDRLAECGNGVILTENLSNLHGACVVSHPELILGRSDQGILESMHPDLVIITGGRLVSKRLRNYVRGFGDTPLWKMEGEPEEALRWLLESDWFLEPEPKGSYLKIWKELENGALANVSGWLKKAPFCNLKAMGSILEAIPQGTVVHLGNSGSVRYAQLMPVRQDLTYLGNRGTSGIDGCVSAAVGAATVSDRLHVLIAGDLSFVYDSNALWNKAFPRNLKVIVLNDGGGGIFRLLEGAPEMPFFEDFSVTHHPVSLELIAQSFGRGFRRASGTDELGRELRSLLEPGSLHSVLEVDTSDRENSLIFKRFFTNHP